jgi:hypothetical protein
MNTPAPPFNNVSNDLLYSIIKVLQQISMTDPNPPFHNVTNDLLYVILTELKSMVNAPVYIGFNILYVSSRYGNDATAQVNNILKPYKTITAAKNHYFSSSDWIHVLEGIYDEGNLFGNYQYWFDNGAEVSYSGAGSIFHQNFGVCIVRGFGKFISTDANAPAINVGNWIQCVLDMECDSIEAQGRAVIFFQNTFFGSPLYKPHTIKARRIYARNRHALRFAFNTYAEVEADEIICDSTTESAVEIGNVTSGTVRNAKITGTAFSPVHPGGSGIDMTFYNCHFISLLDDPSGHAVFFDDAVITNLHISSTRMEVKNAGAKSIYGTHNFNLLLDSNVSANTDTGGTAIITYLNKETKIRLDNNEASIDITGLSSFDLSTFQNAEVIRLSSSNPAETISTIVNAPAHHSIKLLPAPGLSLTVNSTDPLSAAAQNIVLSAPSIILNGSKGDWLELRSSLFGTGIKEILVMNY